MGRRQSSTSDATSAGSRSPSQRQRRANLETFECVHNAIDYRNVGLIDIRIKDGTVVIPDDARTDKSTPRRVKPGPHLPGIARIFLCPSDDYLDALQDYLESGDNRAPDGNESRIKQESYAAGNESNHCAYDLRDLSHWVSRQESLRGGQRKSIEKIRCSKKEKRSERLSIRLVGSDAIFTFNELFFVAGSRGDEGAYGSLVQHKVYLVHHEEDKLTNVSECQQAFIGDGLDGRRYFKPRPYPPGSADTFLALFALELPTLDLDEFERAVQYEICPKLTTNLMKTTDAISTDYFKAMEGRIYSFNRMKCLVEKAEDIEETWALLSHSLNINDEQSPFKDFRNQLRIETLRCSSLAKHTKRLDARYQDLFALNTTVSQSRQSFFVTTLTVLAAVFLPLSLASAVLSMQYRLHELGPRLYDFFGVAWLFCTFALVCFVLVRCGNRLFDRFWNLKHLEKGNYNIWRGSIKGITYSYILGWILVLVSFLLGMFLRDQSIDWKAYPFLALGITIFVAAPFVVPVLDVLITILRLFGACFSFPRRAKRERNDSGTGHVRRRKATARHKVLEEV